MIPAAAITAWGTTRPWPNRDQVEQDLLLARTIVAIYNDPLLSTELVFRGGTCLHQAHLPIPLRYSEDLDFVRRTHTEIGPIFDAPRDVAAIVGLSVKDTVVGQHPKMRFQAAATGSAATLRIKVEINTHETSPAQDLIELPLSVSSTWFSGGCGLTTFRPAELASTKIRALFQRSKGRDVFDLWLALEHMHVDPQEILDCFDPYRPEGFTSARAIENLRLKLMKDTFRSDLDLLVARQPPGYDIDKAGTLIIEKLLSHVQDPRK